MLPSVVYSQLPLLLSIATIATPSAPLTSTSDICPFIKLEISVPLLLASSSLMALRSFAPESTGAVLTSTSSYFCCKSILTARSVSIEPVEYSSAQSPPSSALPVRSSEAATSAPVSCARVFINSSPSTVEARSQP